MDEVLNPARLVQIFFGVVFSAGFSITLRVAHDWFPFTPTYTDRQQWWGWRDVVRFFTSGVALFALPFYYLAYILVSLNDSGQHFDFSRLGMLEILRITTLLLLGIFPFGLYVVWQSVMKISPSFFYSDSAIKRIEEKFPAAFSGNTVSTLLWGIFWCSLSIAPYQLYLWFSAS